MTSERAEVTASGEDGTTHKCPPQGSGLTPCCGRTPFEIPRTDRLTLDEELVTCGKP